ncbi:MAG: bifunctional diguanylate cyclase/phosphodiesterase [Cyanobacteria bacterium J06588_5]
MSLSVAQLPDSNAPDLYGPICGAPHRQINHKRFDHRRVEQSSTDHNQFSDGQLNRNQLSHCQLLATADIARMQSLDSLPMSLVATGLPKVGLALIAGAFGMLLTVAWLKICRLTASLNRREQRIQSLLNIDPLTSLSNRKHLCQTGRHLLSAHPTAAVCLLSINIDRFKAINEGFGHYIGDELLRQVGDRLKNCIAPEDTLARMGNDEFSLLLAPQPAAAPGEATSAFSAQTVRAKAAHRAKRVAECILHEIHQPFYIQSAIQSVAQSTGQTTGQTIGQTTVQGQTHAISIEVSLGIAIGQSQRDFSQLLSQANAAMNQAKKAKARQRKNHHSYLVFQPEMATARAAIARLSQDIQRAVSQEELCVRYQPIVNLETGQTVGFETLVRWQHPNLGLLSPNCFLPTAEEIGLIVDIDRWVMEVACQQLLTWQSQQLNATLSVNLSGSHLGQADLVSTVQGLLSGYPINPANLHLEVTEGVMIADLEAAIATLTQLRQMGLKVSLDDFGTGYCSFGYLQQFPVDILKIDKSFVNGVLPTEHSPSQDNIIVESLLALSERLGIKVVAEGIERNEQYYQLQKMRCAYGQGNLFAQPLTPEAAQALLENATLGQYLPEVPMSESAAAIASRKIQNRNAKTTAKADVKEDIVLSKHLRRK